jgi:hypothetical protein
VLGAVTALALLLMLWAVSKPAICAAVDPPMGSCSQQSRILPATIGALVVLVLAAATVLLALRSRGRREGVSRAEGIVAGGTMLIAVVGIVFVIVVLFSAGFSLP